MPALIVLPGLDGTATLHDEFVHAVQPAFSTIHVLAYPTESALSYDELEHMARASLPSREPFLLLGESFSGPIALRIAAQPPPNLIGLVLSTTFATNPVPLGWLLSKVAVIAPVRTIPLGFLSWWLLGRWTTPSLRSALRDALSSVAAHVLRQRASAALTVDVTRCLGDIEIPTLFLRATEDRLLGRAAGTQIAESISDIRLADIAGPHLLLQAVPEAGARAIFDFAAEIAK